MMNCPIDETFVITQLHYSFNTYTKGNTTTWQRSVNFFSMTRSILKHEWIQPVYHIVIRMTPLLLQIQTGNSFEIIILEIPINFRKFL